MYHITISGLPGSGTSVAAKNLSKILGWQIWNTGNLFRQWAKKYNMKPHEFGQYICSHPIIDKKLDITALQKIKKSKKPMIYEGRLAGWLTKKHKIPAFRIWLWAPQKIRLKRVSRRDKLKAKEAWLEVVKRENEEIERYKKYYDIDLRNLSIYDMVIDTSKTRPTQTQSLILKKLQYSLKIKFKPKNPEF